MPRITKENQCIALDGPVAVGKSTVGRLLAQRLGFRFFDTGAMYRALTWKVLKLGISLDDEGRISQLAREAGMELVDGGVVVDGERVTAELRLPAVELEVSQVSSYAAVRQALVAKQRKMARGGAAVMAGRDIGTVVLPRAGLKVFLAASTEERARRRFRELGWGSYEAILEELKRRDGIDSQRKVSPLRPALDARILDTEGLGLEAVVDKILSLWEGK